MPLIGIIAKKKDFQLIKKEIRSKEIEIIEITEIAIENLKNIKFDEIIFMKDIKLASDTYKYMSEAISKAKYLIINSDIQIKALQEIKIKKLVKLITFGFNTKATITISSVKDDKIIICVQRSIEKTNQGIIEAQERDIQIMDSKNKKTYNNLIVFIIKELHNL